MRLEKQVGALLHVDGFVPGCGMCISLSSQQVTSEGSFTGLK